MLAAHVALLALIGLTPALLLLDGAMPRGFVEIYAAAALVTVGIAIRPGEVAHLWKTLRWIVPVALLPVLWLVMQTLPLPGVGGVSGSIWQSAAAALGTPLWSRISIDPGLTLLALFRYLAIAALVIVAAAATLDRPQAERAFYALGAATLLIALVVVIDAVFGLGLLDDHGGGLRAAAIAASCYGVLVFAGIAILAVERHLTRRSADERSPFLLVLGAAVAGLAVCLLATLTGAPAYAAFATGCGLVAIAVVYFVRRLGLGWMAGATMGGAALIGAALVVAARGQAAAADLSLRYAAWAGTEFIAAAERMLAGVGLFGSGSGTFDALYRIFGTDTGGLPVEAPTFAGRLAIETGRLSMGLFALAGAALVWLCAAGGFNRGRDFFYPVVGAGIAVTTLILAFCDNSLSNSGLAALFAIATGLALSQSASRTV